MSSSIRLRGYHIAEVSFSELLCVSLALQAHIFFYGLSQTSGTPLGETALMVAAQYGHPDICKMLVAHCPALEEIGNAYGQARMPTDLPCRGEPTCFELFARIPAPRSRA